MSQSRGDQSGPSSPDPDEDLLRKALEAPDGDLRAFEELVVRHQNHLIANCRYITRDPNNAEDLAQEVLVKAFFGLRGFERRSSFGIWLRRIKINHCMNHLKKKTGQPSVGIDEAETDNFDQLTARNEEERLVEAMSERQLIGEVLGSMSASLRIPLILCDMDELSYEEVAQFLGISLSATKMRIKRGREEFRMRYQKLQEPVVRVVEQ
jgi:RNA polymerase sigma-70 factor (ECF subfamily)